MLWSIVSHLLEFIDHLIIYLEGEWGPWYIDYLNKLIYLPFLVLSELFYSVQLNGRLNVTNRQCIVNSRSSSMTTQTFQAFWQESSFSPSFLRICICFMSLHFCCEVKSEPSKENRWGMTHSVRSGTIRPFCKMWSSLLEEGPKHKAIFPSFILGKQNIASPIGILVLGWQSRTVKNVVRGLHLEDRLIFNTSSSIVKAYDSRQLRCALFHLAF